MLTDMDCVFTGRRLPIPRPIEHRCWRILERGQSTGNVNVERQDMINRCGLRKASTE